MKYIDNEIKKTAARLYNFNFESLSQLEGGNTNYVFTGQMGATNAILKIYELQDDSFKQKIESVSHWVHFLKKNNAFVPEIFTSVNGNVIEEIKTKNGSWFCQAMQKIDLPRAETLPLEKINFEFFDVLGISIGKLHEIASKYEPEGNIEKRPDWLDSDNCFNPTECVDLKNEIIAQKRAELLKKIKEFPQNPNNFGLIHADLHFGNFFVDFGNKSLAIIDFEECSYGWYVMDIAMLLLDVIILFEPNEVEQFAINFLQHFLKGYSQHKQLLLEDLEKIPIFINLLEIGIYIQVYDFYDEEKSFGWVKTFMQNRKKRLEKGIPLIRFESISFREVLHFPNF